MAVLRSRPRDLRAGVAMVAGAVIGLALLANLGPPRGDDLEAVPVSSPPPTHLRAREPRPQGPAPRPLPAAPPSLDPPAHPREDARLAPRPEPSEGGAAALPKMVVDIVDADGRPADSGSVTAIECPGFRQLEPGYFEADPGPCTLRAVRQDGLLVARSPRATVELREGEVGYLQLELGAARTGGVGVRFRPMGLGMQVLQVVPGTPAWEAGLEPGDVIVSVDGQAVTDLDPDSFVSAMTGPEGSVVEFTVAFPTEDGPQTETLAVERAYLEG